MIKSSYCLYRNSHNQNRVVSSHDHPVMGIPIHGKFVFFKLKQGFGFVILLIDSEGGESKFLKFIFSQSFYKLISIAFPLQFVLGEYHRTPLMVSQHCSGNGLVPSQLTVSSIWNPQFSPHCSLLAWIPIIQSLLIIETSRTVAKWGTIGLQAKVDSFSVSLHRPRWQENCLPLPLGQCKGTVSGGYYHLWHKPTIHCRLRQS